MESSGLTAKDSSFTAADAALDANTLFTIPQFDELDYKPYLRYAELIIGSTLGIIKLNEDLEVEYDLLSAPSSIDIRDDNLVIRDSVSVDINYKDITTTLIGFNPHANDEDNIDASETASATATSNKSEFLNEVVNVDRFRHVLERIDNRIDDHIDVRSARRAIYTFTTATEDIDTELGQDVHLENDAVLGDSTTQDVKIIETVRSSKSTKLRADDLGELS